MMKEEEKQVQAEREKIEPKRSSGRQTMSERFFKSILSSVGSSIGRNISRTILKSILGSKR